MPELTWSANHSSPRYEAIIIANHETKRQREKLALLLIQLKSAVCENISYSFIEYYIKLTMIYWSIILTMTILAMFFFTRI